MRIKEILFWLLILTSIVLLIWRILGNSPTTDLVIYPLIIALVINAWTINGSVSSLKTRMQNFEKQFAAMAIDFKEHLKNFSKLQNEVSELSKAVSELSRNLRKNKSQH